MQRSDRGARIQFLLSMLIWGSIGLFRRLIPLSSASLACFRGGAGALILFLYAVIFKKGILSPVPKKQLGILILSGAIMGLNWLLLFEAYNYTTVATATLCYYMQPTLLILLSPVFFRERITLKKILCAVAALCGMILVSGVTNAGNTIHGQSKGVLMGLCAAVLYTFVVILNKRLTGINVYLRSSLQLLSACVILLPYVLLSASPLYSGFTSVSVIALVLVGIIHTGAAYALYFSSLNRIPAQTAALLGYLDPVTALLLSALFLSEPLTVPGAVGAILIIGASLIAEVPFSALRRPEING